MSEYINKVLTVLQELRIPVELLPLDQIRLYSPWRYTAMIFGQTNVMTFDGKVYSIPAYSSEEQTYVLARDFVDTNFTLLVQKRRITLVVRNMSVSIDDENAVHINGLPTIQELPYQTPISKEMTIMAKGPWVNVTSTKGIALSCNVDQFLCIFHLSGWYHEKSRGLFGNLDTEHHNEFILPEGGITTDIAEFISAYDVSPYDMPRNVIPSRVGLCRSIPEKCRDMFLDESSMLNATFRDINQTEFYNFCVEQTKSCNPTCEATNPVVTLGKEFDRIVNYDPLCLDCTIGELTQEIGRPTSSADVIFVVAETARMAEDNVIKSSMKNIIDRINNKLNAYEVNNVRYGLVAYSGADIHEKPHIHTLCGHVMDSSVDCAYSGVESLEFQGAIQLDAMKAIQLAASYQFRKEAAKIIILIADEDVMEESTSRFDFLFNINVTVAAVQKRLERQGITFNVFSSYSTLNKKSTDSPILGVNYLGKQIINKKNSGEVGIDRLDIPKGQYARLAKATRGSVMGLRWLQTGHRDLNTMLPRMIWKQIQPQATGQVDFICRCVIGMYGESRNECQITRFVDGMY